MKKQINNISDAKFICNVITQKTSTGKPFTVDVYSPRKPRNLNQNSLYWVWVNAIVVQTMGVIHGKASKSDTDSIHDELRKRLLPVLEKKILGEKREVLTSTTDLSEKEFAHYLSCIKLLALEYDVYLYSQEEEEFNQFYNTYKVRK